MTYYVARPFMEGGQEFIVTDDGRTWIPRDPANAGYVAFLAWLAEGNTPEEWTPIQGGDDGTL